MKRGQLAELAKEQAAKLTPEILAEVTGHGVVIRPKHDMRMTLARMRRGDLEQVVLRLLNDGALLLDENGTMGIVAGTDIETPAEKLTAAFARFDPKGTGLVGLNDFIEVMSGETVYDSKLWNSPDLEPLEEEDLILLFQKHGAKEHNQKIEYKTFVKGWPARSVLQTV
jgi:hypothetical protein